MAPLQLHPRRYVFRGHASGVSDAAPTQTRVKSEVHGLAILGRVHVAHAAVGLISRSAAGQEQPAIRLEGNVLEGVRIDDARLAIKPRASP
jgi:hypothetical protein